ncbi:hypothetical protein HPP92_000550 [Vanilla planifolia]|uniref:Uncharacterized protein n=1 Tax=Vanilla planifolia TaxID=51239 RepID=A0A835SAX8_VANPL|nr:hypothetical protein HPP92_000550 [Vanilla planifolia]
MSTSVPQSSSNNDEQWLDSNRGFDSGGRIMLSAVLSLVFVAIVISVHLYARYRRRYDGVDRYVVTAAALRSGPSPAMAVAGLAPATIAALPSFAYQGPGWRRRRVRCVPERGGGGADAAAAGMPTRLPRGLHRHVAVLAFHVSCVSGRGKGGDQSGGAGGGEGGEFESGICIGDVGRCRRSGSREAVMSIFFLLMVLSLKHT